MLILFFLTFAIERKVALAGDAFFRPAINIRSHDLHAGDIREAMGEIASYHERGWFSPCVGSCRLHVFLSFFGLPFVFWPSIFIGFFFCVSLQVHVHRCIT